MNREQIIQLLIERRDLKQVLLEPFQEEDKFIKNRLETQLAHCEYMLSLYPNLDYEIEKIFEKPVKKFKETKTPRQVTDKNYSEGISMISIILIFLILADQKKDFAKKFLQISTILFIEEALNDRPKQTL